MIAWGRKSRRKRLSDHLGGRRSKHDGDNVVRTRDSNEIEVIVLDDQKSRELTRIRQKCSAVYLNDVVNKYTGIWT